MKAYVTRFDEDGRRARKTFKQPDITDEATVAQFSASPVWTMPEWQAQQTSAHLNHAVRNVTNVQQHHCQFEMEEVAPGEFAVFCNDHPE